MMAGTRSFVNLPDFVGSVKQTTSYGPTIGSLYALSEVQYSVCPSRTPAAKKAFSETRIEPSPRLPR
jgi:hypothetical protein